MENLHKMLAKILARSLKTFEESTWKVLEL